MQRLQSTWTASSLTLTIQMMLTNWRRAWEARTSSGLREIGLKVCCWHKQTPYVRKRRGISTQIGRPFLSSGFALTSTIVGGDQAKTILSALAGQSTATRTNIDANVYQNQLVPALTKVMDAERNRISVEMDSKRGTSVTNYSADDMIRLANQYHQACSFQKAMQLLLDAGLNKEGLDSIVQDMNLRSAGAALEQSISRGRALGLSDEQLNQLRERYLRVNLQISGNAEAAPVPTPASPPAPEPSPSPTG